MNAYESLYCDVVYELNSVNFGDKTEEDKSFQYLLSAIEAFENNREIEAKEKEEMLRIINNDSVELDIAYFNLLEFLNDMKRKVG